MKTWSFAAETRNDSLLSAVPAVLAQLLKIISRYLEFRNFGLSLCESLLYRDQVALLERGLTASTSKPHLISPCLRLLTEVVNFDGGASASDVFSHKDKLFKRLDSLLGESLAGGVPEIDDRSKPTIRSNGLRFLLAILRYLDADEKSELILHGRHLQALLRGIEYDTPELVHETLQMTEKSILGDSKITRNLTGRFLNPGTLASLSKLYEYDYDGNEISAKIHDRVHKLLTKICTDCSCGVRIAQTGWYPTGSDPNSVNAGKPSDCVDLGLDSPEYFDNYAETVPVKNSTLSTFIQTLTPETNALHASLMISIFENAPELVAEYFTHKNKFKSPPKDEPEWRGEFAFLFKIIQLPVPKFCGAERHLPAMPPPVSIVIESILPRSLTQGVLTKWINLNDDVVSMSASRLITVALDKLKRVIQSYKSATTNEFIWSQAAVKLKQTFLQRSPTANQIAASATKIPKDKDQLRNAMIQCLAKFLAEHIEQSANVKFNVAAALTEVGKKLLEDDINAEAKQSISQHIAELVDLATKLPQVQWWKSTETNMTCPCVLLLELIAIGRLSDASAVRCRHVVQHLLIERGVLHQGSSFRALMTSIEATEKWSPSHDLFVFINECVHRIVLKPVKYLDSLEQAQQFNSDKKPLSLLAFCIPEQWGYIARTGDRKWLTNVAGWVARFFTALDRVGENYPAMVHIQDEMLNQADDESAQGKEEQSSKARKLLQKALNDVVKHPIEIPSSSSQVDSPPISRSNPPITPQPTVDLDSIFPAQPPIPTTLPVQNDFNPTDLPQSIKSGKLASLFRLLSSPDPELRLSALHTLTSLHHSLSTASPDILPSKTQLHLLVGELLSTATTHTTISSSSSAPFPSAIPELAALLARVVLDPSDRMYVKANTFLLKSPTWNTSKLLSYWLAQTLHRKPEVDDSFSLEADRLLVMLADGLRTAEDLEMYRRQGVWERVMALALSPGVGTGLRRRVFAVVYRAMRIESGGGMLIRRAAVRGWLDVVAVRVEGEEKGIVDGLRTLVKEIEGTEDIKGWRERLPARLPEEKGVDEDRVVVNGGLAEALDHGREGEDEEMTG